VTSVRTGLDERFDAAVLDPQVWFPYYLPHWSSRAASAPTLRLDGPGLHLSIPAGQPLWCPDRHREPLRVSCIQSGSFAGPLGSTIGQQPFADGLTVREEQPTLWGYTPQYGHIEVRMRAVVSPRSMVAFWLSGIEDSPERSGEICVVEVFGDGIHAGTAELGTGVKKLGDPKLVQEFSADPVDLDVADFHTYAVDWRPDSLVFSVDGEVVRRSAQSPDYPVQLMLGLFDFPAKAEPGGAEEPVPELFVTHVRGRPLDD
jgi:Glycosyl hydrolases family 16